MAKETPFKPTYHDLLGENEELREKIEGLEAKVQRLIVLVPTGYFEGCRDAWSPGSWPVEQMWKTSATCKSLLPLSAVPVVGKLSDAS